MFVEIPEPVEGTIYIKKVKYLGAVPWKYLLKTQSIDHQAIKSRFGIVKSC
jgi:hypothetical protein